MHFSIEFSAPLSIADENYCVGGVTRTDATLTLVVVFIIICVTIYALIIQAFILNEVP